LLTLLIAGILPVCLARFFLESREKEADLGNLFWGFKNSYGRNVLTTFLMRLFISLWSLLFVIPGIVKKYQYSMIPYLLAENPEMSRKRAFELTKSMTKGYKWNLFVLNLSFIGWYILSFIVCCGLPLFFLAPYYQATWAEAYTFLKARALEKGLATEEDFPGFVEKTETSEIPAEVEE
ncbi:MAG: DUF975 family protein, partial [Clostridia bacterium]|nr:DUF975 family protein [Clostridia bacterium]